MSEENKTENQGFRAKSIQEVKKENKKNKKIKEIKGKKALSSLVIVLSVLVLIFIAVKLNKKCLVLSIGDVNIGTVESKKSLETLKGELASEISEAKDVAGVEFNEEIKITKIKYDKTLIDDDEKIINGLRNCLTYKIKAVTLIVNDKEIAVFKNGKQFNEVLNILRHSKYEDTEIYDFYNSKKDREEYFYGDIKTGYTFLDEADIPSNDQIVTDLQEEQEQRTYKVKSNDSLTTIAEKNDMKVEDLLLANRGFVENQILTTGQEINLDIPMPKLAIISYEEKVYTAVIEPVVEKVLRDDQYEDYYKVLEPGKDGEKQITERIKLVGETEISTEIVKEVILEESVKKKVEIGSKKLPSHPDKSMFMYPTSGIVTTYFGDWRGSYAHSGVDIANSTGTPIYASYPGTVIQSDDAGNGYGLCVQIEHSSGWTTLYGHCSEILVEYGQKVQKGDVIALMGSTGDSTGPHLHFEIIHWGEKVDPFDYVPYW